MPDSKLRLFFALWPDAIGLAPVAALAGSFSEGPERPIPPERIHMTLAFLGTQPSSALDTIRAVAENARAEPFDIVLDRTGLWRKERVAWLASTTPPSPLMELHEALVSSLRTKGIAVDDRAYSPHVTLARGVAAWVAQPTVRPIVWKVRAFSLVASQTQRAGPTYRRVGEWPLG